MKYFLTPGPAHLYPGVKGWITEALNKDIGSISHRSQTFMDIHRSTVEGIKTLMKVPQNFHVFFHSSATEIWERLPQNCVLHKSFHFVNGNFAERYFKAAENLGLTALKDDVPWGEGFDFDTEKVPQDVEMINFTHNETSTGVMLPLEKIYTFRDSHPEALITLDMVSSAPFPEIDWSKIDAAYFSVQKCFGMPPGLGVLILNDRILAATERKSQSGKSIGTYHNFLAQYDKYQKSQTVETPNFLAIYILGKVCAAMLERGIDTMRKQLFEQANLLYDYFDSHPTYQPFVSNKSFRSPSVVIVDIPNDHKKLMERMAAEDLILGNGYGKMKGKQIRIANFPALPIEIFQEFLKKMEDFR